MFRLIKVLEKIAIGFLSLLPFIFTFCNYFTVLPAEQRSSKMGIAFLVVSIFYGLLCLYFFYQLHFSLLE